MLGVLFALRSSSSTARAPPCHGGGCGFESHLLLVGKTVAEGPTPSEEVRDILLTER